MAQQDGEPFQGKALHFVFLYLLLAQWLLHKGIQQMKNEQEINEGILEDMVWL